MAHAFFLLCTVLLSVPAVAHEFWALPPGSPGEPAVICGGHSFPRCALAPGKGRFDGLYLHSGGESSPVKVSVVSGEKSLLAGLPAGATPVMLSFSLKRPPKGDVVYSARTLTGDAASAPVFSSSGKYFELVPLPEGFPAVKGGTVRVSALAGGKPVAVTLEITAPGGIVSTVRTLSREGGAAIRLRGGGLYLITASYQGQGASLVFPAAEKK